MTSEATTLERPDREFESPFPNKPKLQPRPYQTKTIECIEFGFKDWTKQLAVLPTGSGKTIIFSWLAQRRLPQRTLILAHRDELIDQAIDKLYSATGIYAQKEKAECRASLEAQVVVASVQTMIRRLDRWPKDHFGLVVVDEAHHVLSASWQRVLMYFNAQVLGVTATPDRGDKQNLGKYFENIATEVGLLDLIRDKYLCPIAIKCVPLEIDLGNVHSRIGDFDDAELGHALEPFLETIAKAVKEHASFRRVLAFLPLCDTSRKFVAACNKVGLKAKHIEGESPDRKEILAEFARGDLDLLSNAMLLTEGFDDPGIDCVIVLRPTRSRPLFAQMIGRGTRIEDTKEDLLLLDFLWLHEQHHIIRPADLLSADEDEANAVTKRAFESSDELDLCDLLSDVQEERAEALREKLAKLADRKAKYISAEEFAMKRNDYHLATYQPSMGWEKKEITEGQAKYLEQAGLDLETISGRGHASVLLDTIFKERDQQPATSKQKWVMRTHGYPDADKATRGEARRFFTQLEQRKKQQPEEIT